MNVAQTTRACSSPRLRLNEREREGSQATRIWVSGTWSVCEYKRHVEIITANARTNLRGRENGDGGRGKRERMRAERWGGNGQVLLNENNSPLSSRREESVSPGRGGDTREGSSTDNAPSERARRTRARDVQGACKLVQS